MNNRHAKSLLWVAICSGLLLNLIGCSEPHSATVPLANTVRFATSVAPRTLDPRFATDAVSARINRLLYRALVDFDAEFRPVADLATWEQLSDTHYRFYLGAQGRQFADGQQLTAADVKATYAFILQPDNISPHRPSLAHIATMEVLDADTLDFKLSKPDALFPSRLVIGIMPASLIAQQHPFQKHPMGSGDFALLAWQSPNQLTLQRRRDGLKLDILTVQEPLVRALKLARGEVDLTQNEFAPELVNWLSQQPHLQISRAQGINFSYLGFNLQDAVAGDLVVRQAIAYALNREEIIEYVLAGTARPASSLLIPSHWAGHPDLPLYAHHPDKARALLRQAGFSADNPVRLTYKTSSNPQRIRLATVIQHQLAAVGIEVDLRTYDWGTFYGDIKAGRFQMFSLAWVGIKNPDIFRYVFHSEAVPPQGANRGRLLNPELDRLIERAEQSDELAEQARLYQQLQAQVFAELPYVPLWYENHVLVANQQVQGYQLSPDGNYDGLKQVWVQ